MFNKVCTSIRVAFSQIYEIIINFSTLFKKTPKVSPDKSDLIEEAIGVEIIHSKQDIMLETSEAPPIKLLQLPDDVIQSYSSIPYKVECFTNC